jgi:hypothetical protein
MDGSWRGWATETKDGAVLRWSTPPVDVALALLCVREPQAREAARGSGQRAAANGKREQRAMFSQAGQACRPAASCRAEGRGRWAWGGVKRATSAAGHENESGSRLRHDGRGRLSNARCKQAQGRRGPCA